MRLPELGNDRVLAGRRRAGKTAYERLRVASLPLLPVLQRQVYRDLRRLLSGRAREAPPPRLLDVGGRSSPYTAGLRAEVTIVDLPRQGEVNETLQLGLTDQLLETLERRRSNIDRVVIEDITRSSLPGASFDGIVSVEVIEHVPEDELFVSQLARLVKPGGFVYLTTPNGDWIKNEPPNYNPDHVRHYRRQELHDLLARHFEAVRVEYAVHTGANRYRGLHSFSHRRLLRTLAAAGSNLINHFESRRVHDQAARTAHLAATAFSAGCPVSEEAPESP